MELHWQSCLVYLRNNKGTLSSALRALSSASSSFIDLGQSCLAEECQRIQAYALCSLSNDQKHRGSITYSHANLTAFLSAGLRLCIVYYSGFTNRKGLLKRWWWPNSDIICIHSHHTTVLALDMFFTQQYKTAFYLSVGHSNSAVKGWSMKKKRAVINAQSLLPRSL